MPHGMITWHSADDHANGMCWHGSTDARRAATLIPLHDARCGPSVVPLAGRHETSVPSGEAARRGL